MNLTPTPRRRGCEMHVDLGDVQEVLDDIRRWWAEIGGSEEGKVYLNKILNAYESDLHRANADDNDAAGLNVL